MRLWRKARTAACRVRRARTPTGKTLTPGRRDCRCVAPRWDSWGAVPQDQTGASARRGRFLRTRIRRRPGPRGRDRELGKAQRSFAGAAACLTMFCHRPSHVAQPDFSRAELPFRDSAKMAFTTASGSSRVAGVGDGEWSRLTCNDPRFTGAFSVVRKPWLRACSHGLQTVDVASLGKGGDRETYLFRGALRRLESGRKTVPGARCRRNDWRGGQVGQDEFAVDSPDGLLSQRRSTAKPAGSTTASARVSDDSAAQATGGQQPVVEVAGCHEYDIGNRRASDRC